MAESRMEDILDLINRDLDDKSETKDRFREFLLKEKWEPEHFKAWIQECVNKGDTSHKVWYNALQDIVVAIGSHLGFDVEFGRYSGSKQEIAFDGLWKRETGEVILVEVKASGWPVTSIGQLGQYAERYAESKEVNEADVFGLYAIGGSEVQHLIDQIKGGKYRNRLRLISFEDLIALWDLKADLDTITGKDAGATRVQSILLPFESVDVGNFVRLMLEIAELKSATGIDQPPVPPVEPPAEPWEKAELFSFFQGNTDWQNACLTVLSLTDEEQIPSNRLLRLAAKVAEGHFPSVAEQPLKNLAGPRAGFKMRRGDKEDFISSEWASDEAQWQNFYWLKSQYREWIREWILSRGYTIPATKVPSSGAGTT
jgi:hypothetical protein